MAGETRIIGKYFAQRQPSVQQLANLVDKVHFLPLP